MLFEKVAHRARLRPVFYLAPVAIVRGAAEWTGEGSGRLLLRDAERDLFR